MAIATERNFLVTATADGVPIGTWDMLEGGDGDSEAGSYAPGGMGDDEPYGGKKTRDNFTLTRAYKIERDAVLYKRLDSQRGVAEISASRHPLDRDKNPVGPPDIFKGILKKVTGPKHDSNGSDAAKWSLEVTPDGGDLG